MMFSQYTMIQWFDINTNPYSSILLLCHYNPHAPQSRLLDLRDDFVIAVTSAPVLNFKKTSNPLTFFVTVQYLEFWESSTVSRKKPSSTELYCVDSLLSSGMSLSTTAFIGLVRHTAPKWSIMPHLWHFASLAGQPS